MGFVLDFSETFLYGLFVGIIMKSKRDIGERKSGLTLKEVLSLAKKVKDWESSESTGGRYGLAGKTHWRTKIIKNVGRVGSSEICILEEEVEVSDVCCDSWGEQYFLGYVPSGLSYGVFFKDTSVDKNCYFKVCNRSDSREPYISLTKFYEKYLARNS